MKKFFLLLSVIVTILLSFLFHSPSNKALGSVKIYPEIGTDPKIVIDAQKAVENFKLVLNDDMKTVLTRDINVYICPTQESYTKSLQEKFKMDTNVANRESKLTSGMSSYFSNVISLNTSLDINKSSKDISYNLSHELFHQIQAQLSHNKNSKSLYWLLEGTADYIGAKVSEKSGYQSIEKWKLDRINIIRNSKKHSSVQEISHSTLEKWATLMEENKHPYEMSDLMVLYLISQQPQNKAYESITEYFRLLDRLDDGDKAFEKAFGVNTTTFGENFKNWLSNNMSQNPQVEIINLDNISAKTVLDIKQSSDTTRNFLKDRFGIELNYYERILLVDNKKSYSNTMSKEFGIPLAEAEQKAKTSVWWYNESTTIIDIGSLLSQQQRQFVTATTIVSRLQNQLAPQQVFSNMTWLSKGTTYIIAASIIEMNGLSTLQKYKHSWLNTLRKAPQVPSLLELKTQSDWENCINKYDTNIVYSTTELSVAYLTEKYGLESLNTWMQTVRNTGDAEKAFVNVYGISSEQFSYDFQDYLNKQL